MTAPSLPGSLAAQDAPVTGQEPRTPGRQRWPWWAAGGVVALVVGAWLVVGLNPTLSSSYTGAADPDALEEPFGFGLFGPDESTVVDPSDGTYDGVWSFRNDGRVPVDVRLAAFEPSTYEWRAHLFSLPDDGSVTDEIIDRAADVLTVGPGESFGVQFALGFGCAEFAGGSGTGIDSLRLDVTTLGLTRTVDVPGGSSVAIMTEKSHHPFAECDGS
ncbi:hypothetical protein CWIS_11000 [Cellulomonas sp. A375-1]|uniref:hypothetical protein n=1 Tax=Cellulomonas sp. A375-1 TaxID=1672219 RepID=UPI0006527165|nr:hypothetical protein [Cellulomonas sp. A375-1]KMM45413.1 hypothetical protein CWIS_11000 [Cellulomonas sp. A375-1]